MQNEVKTDKSQEEVLNIITSKLGKKNVKLVNLSSGDIELVYTPTLWFKIKSWTNIKLKRIKRLLTN